MVKEVTAKSLALCCVLWTKRNDVTMIWGSSIFDDVCRNKLGVGGGGNSVEAEEQGPQLGWGVLNRGQSSGLLAGFNRGVEKDQFQGTE